MVLSKTWINNGRLHLVFQNKWCYIFIDFKMALKYVRFLFVAVHNLEPLLRLLNGFLRLNGVYVHDFMF
jgi:hypothetical protein